MFSETGTLLRKQLIDYLLVVLHFYAFCLKLGTTLSMYVNPLGTLQQVLEEATPPYPLVDILSLTLT